MVETHCFGGAPTPPGGERIACSAFYEVAMLMPTQNESNFNKLLGCFAFHFFSARGAAASRALDKRTVVNFADRPTAVIGSVKLTASKRPFTGTSSRPAQPVHDTGVASTKESLRTLSRSNDRQSATWGIPNIEIDAQIPCSMLTRSFHFAIFTPFTRSHRQNDDSPINGGTRIAGIIRSANVGAKSAAEQAAR